MPYQFEFRALTTQDYEKTLDRWKTEAENADLFPHEVENGLSWIPGTISQSSNNPASFSQRLAYGVFPPSQHAAVAICELVLTCKGNSSMRWLKMLKVTLSPELRVAIENEDVDGTTKALVAYRTAVVGAMAERLIYEADTLKLYGRSDDHLRFLLILMAVINEKKMNLEAHKEGRWLIIKPI